MCRFRQLSPDVTECGCLKAIVLFKPGKNKRFCQCWISVIKRVMFTYTNYHSPLLAGSNFGFPASNRLFPGQ